MLALYKAKDYQRGLRALEDLPAAVRPAALARPSFLRAAASLQTAGGNLTSAEGLLRRAMELETANGGTASFYTQLQLAQTWVEQGQHDRAAWMFSELTKSYPDNPEGWKGLMLVLHREQRDADALEMSRRIPAETNQRLQEDTDYLSLLASLYGSNGQPEEALQAARHAVARYQSAGQTVPTELTLQLAWLLFGVQGNERELFLLLRETRARADLTLEQRQRVDELLTTWVLRSAQAATEAENPDRAVQILESAMRVLPAEQKIRRALAGNLLAAGDSRRALALYRAAGMRNAAAADFVAAVGTALAERQTQIANTWLDEGLKKYPTDPDLLNIAGRQAAAKGDFQKAELYWRQALQSIQVANRKRAAANTLSLAKGYTLDPLMDQATDDLGAVLLGGTEVPPAPAERNRRPPSGLKPEDRLPWLFGPNGAAPSSKPIPPLPPLQPPSTRPAPQNPLVPQTSSAEPDLPSLLREMRDRMEPAGSPDAAAQSLLAMARHPERASAAEPAPPAPADDRIPERKEPIRAALAPATPEPPPPSASAPRESLAGAQPEPPGQSPSQEAPAAPVYNARLVESRSAASSALRRYLKKGALLEGGDVALSALQPPPGAQGTPQPPPATDDVMKLLRPATPAPVQQTPRPSANIVPSEQISKEEQIENQLQVMEGRNSPSLGMGGFFQSRSGQPGFEKMMLQESDLEASTIVANRLRLSLQARAIFLNTPAADGTSTLRFGLLPAGDTFEAQAVSGLGADVQAATTNFGLHFGATPRGVPVRNLLGGFRFRPAGGPITIQFERDNVRDSVLAYAGAQDPLTHTVWGGVVSNTASLAGNWGDERSGAYFSTSFQYLTGKRVENNQRIDGNVGLYWRLVTTTRGSLTAGANLFAMHYEKNLRYFTLGHGGYFSPQRFVLLGVPVSWTGTWKHLQYVANTTIGSQSFSENCSPYFPTAPCIQSQTGPFYPRYSSSGTNYNADFRLAYQVSPNWYVGGFYNANNARFYTLQTVGFTVRYSLQSRPLDTEFSV
ncbi:MAG TPA: cellulose synthase subunit BcsC-related outer membrane protein, partial [Bryobacteraceae bacterium]|nr:cellulose synthase subunit BcsC-related outer membrane protein [Bryobacteraceae bacterium]